MLGGARAHLARKRWGNWRAGRDFRPPWKGARLWLEVVRAPIWGVPALNASRGRSASPAFKVCLFPAVRVILENRIKYRI